MADIQKTINDTQVINNTQGIWEKKQSKTPNLLNDTLDIAGMGGSGLFSEFACVWEGEGYGSVSISESFS